MSQASCRIGAAVAALCLTAAPFASAGPPQGVGVAALASREAIVQPMRAYAPYPSPAAGKSAAPDARAQVLGPGWRGRWLDVEGRVMAVDGACRELNVLRGGVEGAGRLWICSKGTGIMAPMGALVRAGGRVNGTRMTLMGKRWRVVPVIDPVRYVIR